jgi:hypothetical protein
VELGQCRDYDKIAQEKRKNDEIMCCGLRQAKQKSWRERHVTGMPAFFRCEAWRVSKGAVGGAGGVASFRFSGSFALAKNKVRKESVE